MTLMLIDATLCGSSIPLRYAIRASPLRYTSLRLRHLLPVTLPLAIDTPLHLRQILPIHFSDVIAAGCRCYTDTPLP